MKEKNFGYIFIVCASVIVILAGVKSASEIVVPFLLSLFIAIILSPSYNYFNKKGLPNALSLTLVMGIFVIFLLFVAKLIGSSVQDFSSNISVYEQQLSSSFDKVFEISASIGFALPKSELSNIINPKQIMQLSSSIVQSIGSMFTNGFVILLSVIFMLLESGHFTQKIAFASGDEGLKKDIQEIVAKIQRYMVLKTIISFFTGLFIYAALLLIGTDYAFLWAVLAFMLNFIPNIGPIIASIPVVLLTIVQLGSLSAVIVGVLYIVINVVIGSIIEPKVMGKGLGLSTLVVFLSLIFWGWLLGIVGMLLSIPLTMMAKIVFDSNKDTKFIAVLLGTEDNLVEKK